MSKRSGRCGVRLASFLVVVAGIAVLLTLVLPAIQWSLESARRNRCSDNLRQIAVALANYHDAHGMFPMGAMHAGVNPGGDPPIEAKLGPSWWFGILPFMDQRGGPKVVVSQGGKGMSNSLRDAEAPMCEKILESQGPGQDVRYEFCADDVNRYLDAHPYTVRDGEHVGRLSVWNIWPEYMRCPTSPLPMSESVIGPIMLPSYVGIAGGCDIDPRSHDYQDSHGLSPAETNHTYRNTYKGTGATERSVVTSSGILPPCQYTTRRDCTDGLSKTMIVAEQSDWVLDRDPSNITKYHGDSGWTNVWSRRNQSGLTGSGGGWLSGTRRVDPVPEVATPGGPPAVWGADCWNITVVRYPANFKRAIGSEVGYASRERKSSATPLPGCSDNHGINNPLQSAHAGGLQAAMADGSVKFISEKTALEVLLRMAIRDDGGQAQTP